MWLSKSLRYNIVYKSVDFLGALDGKESDCNAGDPGLIIRLGRSSGEGNGNPLMFLLEEFHGQRSLVGPVHGVTKSKTLLSDLHFHSHTLGK